MKKMITIMVIVVFCFNAMGQNGLTPRQIEAMKIEGEQVIVKFQNNLKELASKSTNNMSDRITTCEICKGLFYERGGRYVDWNGNPDACTIEIIRSYRDQTKVPKIVCDYLDALARTQLNLQIEDCNTIRIDQPYKRPDGRYTCTAHFYQAYIRYSNDGSRVIYSDETSKTAVLIIEIRTLPDDTVEFYVNIEDIKADECKPYNKYRR